MSKIDYVKLNREYIGSLMKSTAMMETLTEVGNQHGEVIETYVTTQRCVARIKNPDETLLGVAKE